MSDATTRGAKADDVRARMLEAAERLLIESGDHDISTRAVCEAIGVAQPILYRLFKDKNGLLHALVQNGFERYVQRKRALESTEDPVADLRVGWDDHLDFALTNGALYRLMFSPALPEVPAPAGRSGPSDPVGERRRRAERAFPAGPLQRPGAFPPGARRGFRRVPHSGVRCRAGSGHHADGAGPAARGPAPGTGRVTAGAGGDGSAAEVAAPAPAHR
jgi:AcrR family transcriptional regulator